MNERELIQTFAKKASQIPLHIDCSSMGSINSEILIIGEAPGDQEVRTKIPLSGQTGRIIWEELRKHGINKTHCYITHTVKRKLTIDWRQGGKIPIKRNETNHWEELLNWEIDQLPKLKYVLILGKMALHAVTGEDSIDNWRGTVKDYNVGYDQRTVKIIVINNPESIYFNPRAEPVFKMDISKFAKVIKGEFIEHKINHIINPSPTEAINFLDKLTDENKPTALDIETMSNETACIGFANDPHEGMCISFRDNQENIFSLDEELKVRYRVQQFLQSDTLLVAQNMAFDGSWLWFKDRIKSKPIWFDTLLAHHTLYPLLPHNLGFLTSQYTTHPYYKDDAQEWKEGGSINSFWEYNVKDCCITLAVAIAELKELKDQKMDRFFFDHVMRLQSHLINMTIGGVLIDEAYKATVNTALQTDLLEEVNKFYKLVYEECPIPEYDNDIVVDLKDIKKKHRPNPNSPQQIAKLLFDNMKLKGRGRSTNALNRQRMRNSPNTDERKTAILDSLDKYKEDAKFFSTYVTSRIDDDGRARCEWRQWGTQRAPGRLSSAGLLWGTGFNFQNQPHKAYPMFIADDGYMFSYFDLRQAEAKVVAYAWEVEALIENFIRAETEEGFDVHRGNAARIFQISYDEIPTYDFDENFRPTKRFLGKKCVHGLNYRMQAPRLAEECKISMLMGYEAFSSYHKAFPEIQSAWEKTIIEIKDKGAIYNFFGRRMIVLGRLDDDLLDSVIAFKPQSTIGDKVAQVIYLAEEDNAWPEDAAVKINVHDALIVQHRPKDLTTVQEVLKTHAEAPIIINDKPITIFCDLKHSIPDEQGVHRWSTLMSGED